MTHSAHTLRRYNAMYHIHTHTLHAYIMYTSHKHTHTHCMCIETLNKIRPQHKFHLVQHLKYCNGKRVTEKVMLSQDHPHPQTVEICTADLVDFGVHPVQPVMYVVYIKRTETVCRNDNTLGK